MMISMQLAGRRNNNKAVVLDSSEMNLQIQAQFVVPVTISKLSQTSSSLQAEMRPKQANLLNPIIAVDQLIQGNREIAAILEAKETSMELQQSMIHQLMKGL